MASQKMQETIQTLKTKDDGEAEDIDDIEDDEDDALSDLDHCEEYIKAAKGKFSCKLCQSTFGRKPEARKHVILSHGDKVSEALEEDDDEVDDEDIDESEPESEERCDDDKTFSTKTPRKRPSTLKKTRIEAKGYFMPSEESIKIELKYRANNYNKNQFLELVTPRKEWVILDGEERLKYLPPQENSMTFRHGKNDNETFGMFEAKEKSFFAGGPVTSSDWCPSRQEEKFLALSTQSIQQDLGLIQIWQVAPESECSMQLGIGHRFGKIQKLLWAPSGNHLNVKAEQHLPRLGLLAAACSDGTVRILSVCQPSSLGAKERNPIALVEPARTLKTMPTEEGKVVECLSMSWYRGLGHRVIAGGFSDGLVCLWNIAIVVGYQKTIMPYKKLLAHSVAVSALDLKPGDGLDYPSYLVTGSADRTLSFWDLNKTGRPTQSMKKSSVTDLTWLPHHNNHVIASFDDAFSFGSTRTLVLEQTNEKIKSFTMMPQNSSVKQHSFNPFSNFLVSGTTAGDVLLLSIPSVGFSLDQKSIPNRRLYLHRSSLDCENDLLDLFTLKEVAAEGTVVERRMNVDKITTGRSIIPEDAVVPKLPENMHQENLTLYPSVSVTTVCQNLEQVSEVFIGYQNGLGRIINFNFVKCCDKML